MTRNPIRLQTISAAVLAVVLSGAAVIALQPAAHANPFRAALNRVRLLIAPPAESTPTGRRDGGASRRGTCPTVEVPLKALVPVREGNIVSANGPAELDYVWEITTLARPTLWFYIPYSPEDVSTAEFMLLDAAKEPALVEPISINLSGTPGIVELELPFDLEVDMAYNWYLEVQCSPERPSQNPVVSGWIQRAVAPPELDEQLNGHPVEQRHVVYAEHGIWYDALTELMERYRAAPSNSTLQGNWSAIAEFLVIENSSAPPEQAELSPAEVQLETLLQAPISDCCSVDSSTAAVGVEPSAVDKVE